MEGTQKGRTMFRRLRKHARGKGQAEDAAEVLGDAVFRAEHGVNQEVVEAMRHALAPATRA